MPLTRPYSFLWYELTAPDIKAALDFYAKIFGWTYADAGMPDMSYTLIQVQGEAIGGAMTLTDEMKASGAQAGWMGYIAVDDIDAKTKEIVAAGGAVFVPVVEIPEMLRFAIVGDPGGAAFALFQPLSEGEMTPFPPGTPGAVDWHELHAANGPAAWAFYSSLFGWEKTDAMPMDGDEVYQLWKAGGEAIGGMMTKMPETPAPFWCYYVCVEGIDAAIARVTANGGTIVHGPMEVPGGSWIANCIDPQGGFFAMVSQTK